MTTGPFAQIAFTHLYGRYCQMRSRDFEAEWEKSCFAALPVVGHNSFVFVKECVYQKPVSDGLTIVGYSEPAFDTVDKRPFVHHHVIVIPDDQYSKLDLHPGDLEPYFLHYENTLAHVKPNEEPEKVALEWSPKKVIAAAPPGYEYFGDQPRLLDILNCLISAALGKGRVTIDFANRQEARDFLFPALALIPKQIRALVPFSIGPNPDNQGITEPYRIILRIVQERGAQSISPLRAWPLAENITSVFSHKGGVAAIHNTLGNIFNQLVMSKPNLSWAETARHALWAYPNSQDNLNQFKSWIDRLTAESLEKPDRGGWFADIDAMAEYLSTLDEGNKNECLSKLAKKIDMILSQDMAQQMQTLLNKDTAETSFFYKLPGLLIKPKLWDTETVARLGTKYMTTLVETIAEKKGYSLKDLDIRSSFGLRGYYPYEFRFSKEKLFRAIDSYLLTGLEGLEKICGTDKDFSARYRLFKQHYHVLGTDIGKK